MNNIDNNMKIKFYLYIYKIININIYLMQKMKIFNKK